MSTLPYESQLRKQQRHPGFDNFAAQKLQLDPRTRTFEQLLKLLVKEGHVLKDPEIQSQPQPNPSENLSENLSENPKTMSETLSNTDKKSEVKIYDKDNKMANLALNTANPLLSQSSVQNQAQIQTQTQTQNPPKSQSRSTAIANSSLNPRLQSSAIPQPLSQLRPQSRIRVSTPQALSDHQSRPGSSSRILDPRNLLLGNGNKSFPTRVQGTSKLHPKRNLNRAGNMNSLHPKTSLLSTGYKFLHGIQELKTTNQIAPTLGSHRESRLKSQIEKKDIQMCDELQNLLNEWYQSKIVVKEQWLECTVEKCIDQLERQQQIETELKTDPLYEDDETDLMAFSFDNKRQKIELESLFFHISQEVTNKENELMARREKEEKWLQENLISSELFHYFIEKRRLLSDYIQRLRNLYTYIAPSIKVLKNQKNSPLQNVDPAPDSIPGNELVREQMT